MCRGHLGESLRRTAVAIGAQTLPSSLPPSSLIVFSSFLLPFLSRFFPLVSLPTVHAAFNNQNSSPPAVTLSSRRLHHPPPSPSAGLASSPSRSILSQAASSCCCNTILPPPPNPFSSSYPRQGSFRGSSPSASHARPSCLLLAVKKGRAKPMQRCGKR